MYRCILFTLTLFSGLEAFALDYSLDRLILGFRAKFQQKCVHIGGENALLDLQVAASKLVDCTPINYNSPETICTNQRQKSYRCYLGFFDKLEPCLEIQEKYMKNLFLRTHVAIFDKICKNPKMFLRTRNQIESARCDKPLEVIVQNYLQNCLPRLRIVQNLYKHDDVITEEDLCQDISTMRHCKFMNVKQYCAEYYVVKHILDIVFDSYLDSCAIDMAKK
ncbi:hypothetical protein RN001_000210 [Aquatica leii]|uniref:Uncharacterized protein n=1 Tax=Aquatica leii TaxID=1421715 RepID=A0AAN7Q2Q9_9COLE|nr:hypothetical protein RN001_000210 [Aquatica leii]